MIPSIGRTVHYVLPAAQPNGGEHRPAIHEGSVVQLQVFLDGGNDAVQPCQDPPNLMWATSVHQDSTLKMPGTWHEPERVEAPVVSVTGSQPEEPTIRHQGIACRQMSCMSPLHCGEQGSCQAS